MDPVLTYDGTSVITGADSLAVTIFTTTNTTALPSRDAPPLTTPYVAGRDCVGRWLLPEVMNSADFLTDPTNVTVYSTRPQEDPSDSYWTMCQAHGTAPPTYSPGVCPDGQKMAKIVEYEYTRSAGQTEQLWQASCCPSGFTISDQYCRATFSTALVARTLVTSVGVAQGTPYTSINYDDFFPGFTPQHTVTLSTGVAVADPVMIAWKSNELAIFPSEYATSLALQLGIAQTSTQSTLPAFPSHTTTQSTLPQAQVSKSRSDGSDSTTIAVAISTAVGVLATTIILSSLLLYMHERRRQARVGKAKGEREIAELEDQDADNATRRWFFGGRWRSEAGSNKLPHQELDSKIVRVVPGPPVEIDGQERQEIL